MKQLIKFVVFAIVASVLFYSCKRIEPVEQIVEEEGLYTYTFTLGNPDTRSTIALEDGRKVINWEEDDKIGVYTVGTNGTSSNKQGIIDLNATPNTFSITSTKALEVNDWVYTYAPQRYMTNDGYANPATAQLSIPTSQTQDGTSFKANAMPMAGTPYQIKEQLAANTPKPVGDIKMINLGAIINFKIYTTDSELANELVKSVTFTSTSAIAGTFEYDLTGVDYDTPTTLAISGYTEKSVTTTVTNPIALGSSKDTGYEVYMVIAPGSYTGTVVVETDKAKYTYPISTAKTFNRNIILNIGVKLNQNVREEILPETSYEWTLVTDASQLVEGSEIVIAASNAEYAMSQVQNTNNRGVVGISKNNNKITWADEANIQIFKIVAGSVNNSIAFKCANGNYEGQYIYAASSSNNQLKTSATLNNNSSWTVAIDGNTFTLTAQGANTHNELRSNPNNGNPMFACYLNSSTTGVLPSLYIKGAVSVSDTKAIISNGEIPVAASGNNADYGNAYSVININENTETITVTSTENIIDPIADGGTVNFSMSPNYTNQQITGSITLTLADDENVTANIPIRQSASSLTVSSNTVTIPSTASSAVFTITSPEFSWSISSEGTNILLSAQSGAASADATEITVSSDAEAGDAEQTLAVLTIIRNNNANDPQAKQITIKKAAAANGVEWVKKDIADIENGDFVVIVDETSSRAMANNYGGNSAPAAIPVTIDNNNHKLGDAPSTEIQFVFYQTDNGYSFNVDGTNKYLYTTNANDGVRVGTNNNKEFVFTDNHLKNIATSRYLGVYSNQDWRCYTSINTNIQNTVTAFYVKTGDDSGQGSGGGSGTVTYTVTSTSSVSASGDVLSGSHATYTQTYSTAGQITKNNSITLTLSGFAGKKITAAKVSVHSNKSSGSGNLSLTSGSTTIASIATAQFNSDTWNGSWSQDFVEKELTVSQTTVGANDNIVLVIAATANSLFFESLTLTYE